MVTSPRVPSATLFCSSGLWLSPGRGGLQKRFPLGESRQDRADTLSELTARVHLLALTSVHHMKTTRSLRDNGPRDAKPLGRVQGLLRRRLTQQATSLKRSFEEQHIGLRDNLVKRRARGSRDVRWPMGVTQRGTKDRQRPRAPGGVKG